MRVISGREGAMSDDTTIPAWLGRKTCERCGQRWIPRNRSLCPECLAVVRAEVARTESRSADQQHLELLRATGRDYAGRKL